MNYNHNVIIVEIKERNQLKKEKKTINNKLVHN